MAKDIILEDVPLDEPPENPGKRRIGFHTMSQASTTNVEKLKNRIRHCSTIQSAFYMLQNEYTPDADQALRENFDLTYQDLINLRGYRYPAMYN